MESVMPVIWAVVVFSLVILSLAFVLIAARRRLLPQGDVQILVNGEKTLTVSPGTTLLNVLSDQSGLSAICMRRWWYMCNV